MLSKATKPFINFVEKYYPDPLIFALLLTFITFILALIFTEANFIEAVTAWGGGFNVLMAFIGQLSFTLIASTALAHTRPVTKGLQKLAGLPLTEFGCYALAAFIGAVASLVSWALGLVVGGIIVRHIQFRAQKKGLKPHYPLLVASAYSGFVIWHMGYSGSVQLFVATKGHAFEKMIGIIPVSQTLFSTYNILGIIVCLITIPILMGLMHPKQSDAIGFDTEAMDSVSQDLKPRPTFVPTSFAERVERMRWINITTAVLLIVYLSWYFSTKGAALNLDVVNWSFLALGLLLSDSPVHYVRLVADAGRNVGQIILQYPLYAGLMGLMTGTGLAKVIAGVFVAFATKTTLTFWAFISAGILNMFIPSGGGQWSVQGAIVIDAAQQLGVPIDTIVSAVAYGDQWTNMIQPFWTIPLLAIAGLKMRDMMGYTFITLIWTGIVFSSTLLVVASFF